MPLNSLQCHLQSIYGVPVPHRVEDFLITDAGLARQLDTSDSPREVHEKLLVRQQDGKLEMSLYLDREVVETLCRSDPSKRLHDGNLQSCLLALEGISHFLYVAWKAGQDQTVTQFELEMQAEVDKYVACLMLIVGQPGGQPHRLRQRLFDTPVFDDALSADDLELYSHANHYAGRYCRELDQRYRHHYGSPEMLRELRCFYRLGQCGKVSRVNAS